MYKPLPDNITIKEAYVRGEIGLIATAAIPKGTVLGIAYYNTVDNGLINTPLGGFYRYNNTPNIIVYEVKIDNLCTLSKGRMEAIKDIRKGEELFAQKET